MSRLAFLTHFVLCLAVAAGAFLAWRAGTLDAVWRGDQSMMTSAIGALLVGTLAWLGVQAWRIGGGGVSPISGKVWHKASERWIDLPDASFGHLAERLLPMMGLAGTVVGLSMQARALMANGSAAFEPLATALYCTGAGIIAAAIVAVATYALERGVGRSGG